MSAKVSVIIPVYNAEKYLRQCLDSILAQDCPEGFDYEVLLVDDGSTDQSGILCDEYAARSPVFRVFHRENGGASAARNGAIRLAKGDYVQFVDSDDWLLPGLFARLAELLAPQPELVLL
ncbi:MAG: glycosyltransferase family 2 protein, partial [Oscillospiraceae bacterium]|nr:glycosyltransferase family 2 protein [Oscillospiraceae bacterium]